MKQKFDCDGDKNAGCQRQKIDLGKGGDKNLFVLTKDDDDDSALNVPSCFNVTNNNFFEMKPQLVVKYEHWINKNQSVAKTAKTFR